MGGQHCSFCFWIITGHTADVLLQILTVFLEKGLLFNTSLTITNPKESEHQ
jgi:hypothetical protein